ncbi:FAD/NAD(P)-binding domain-containing protein [Penicillium samsonianum]|uniref:FAD/NAD(P)-binding domain-containing protein n=1 Tax=Penicillium samsonianum TaxID=1882272 RepID=UPI0025490B09|nr:FAD/NAD(P)-binding domain-containing protein [Penicillium samsonianum]KAJ6131991.1 FAD/NAD(P)-binding domain-containing protein [Penicillium samsonianum]
MNKDQFHVIIVGGSIAGLTLAHCLHRAGISHVVLEKASEPAPQIGASVGILPNGARVLDQLQLYETIEKYIEPLETATIGYPDGFSFSSSYPKLVNERFGFPIAFLDRQKLLEILYQHYPDKSRIRLAARVVSIESSAIDSTVTTEDGTIYKGHLIVGADGVHSRVRSEMWKAAQRIKPGLVTKREQRSMTVEYSCIFGISAPIKGLIVGEQVNAFFDHLTIVTIHGKNGRVYWFLIQKLDRKYIYPECPRFTAKEIGPIVSHLKEIKFFKDITFGQLWDSRETASMTALEENVFDTWYHGRMVLMGDSVHKMTPNIGQGANMAIEDAAVLSSLLSDLLQKQTQPPTNAQIERLLAQYREVRYPRVNSIYKTSRFLVRFQARDGIFNTLFGRYYAPHAGDLPADMASKTIAGGELCAYLPSPNRCSYGWEKYKNSGLGRTVWCVLVLILSALTWSCVGNMNIIMELPKRVSMKR